MLEYISVFQRILFLSQIDRGEKMVMLFFAAPLVVGVVMGAMVHSKPDPHRDAQKAEALRHMSERGR